MLKGKLKKKAIAFVLTAVLAAEVCVPANPVYADQTEKMMAETEETAAEAMNRKPKPKLKLQQMKQKKYPLIVKPKNR